MDDRVAEWLNDILAQLRDVRSFTDGMTFEIYEGDLKTKAAVERKFEIIGEAMNRIRGLDPRILDGIRDYRDIISFRNILAHGYDDVDSRLVWGIVEGDIKNLNDDVERILRSRSPRE